MAKKALTRRQWIHISLPHVRAPWVIPPPPILSDAELATSTPLDAGDEREQLIAEGREAMKQTFTIVGVASALIAFSLPLIASELHEAWLRSPVSSLLASIVCCSAAVFTGYVIWTLIVQGQAFEAFQFNGDDLVRTDISWLRQSAWRAIYGRRIAISLLYLYPVFAFLIASTNVPPATNTFSGQWRNRSAAVEYKIRGNGTGEKVVHERRHHAIRIPFTYTTPDRDTLISNIAGNLVIMRLHGVNLDDGTDQTYQREASK